MSRRRTAAQEKIDGVDISLAKLPGRTVWDRKTRTRLWLTTLPTILRDLAPNSGFDPQLVWRAAQEKEEEENRQEVAATVEVCEVVKKKGSSGGKKAGSGASKKQKYIDDNDKNRNSKARDRDEQRIRNNKCGGARLAADNLVSIRNNIETPAAKLELLLEILGLAVGCKDKALAFDVFWAIEKNALYQEGKAGLAERKLLEKALKKEMEEIEKAAKKAEKEAKKDKKDGKEKDKKDKKKDKSDEKVVIAKPTVVVPPKTVIGELLTTFKIVLKTALDWREAEDMVVVQLTVMSDRLPPLSPFASAFKLDDWQIRVLKMIDKRQSVVICAPTSSGKTVISTYVASLGRGLNKAGGPSVADVKKKPVEKVIREDGLEEYDSDEEEAVTVAPKDRVLFVVPTEPLVWQVAAHFAKHILAGNVAVVTNQLTYCPHKKLRNNDPPAVVVGTPMALESALTKIRGDTADMDGDGKVQDKSKMVGGFDHYGWVVYDEIHALDGEEGEALQRLIRLMNCNFLALSATVGNAEQLRTWMEEVRCEQLQVEVVNALPPPPPSGGVEEAKKAMTRKEEMAALDASDALRRVKIQEHKGRFLNIQRHLWTSASTGLQNALEGIANLKVGADGTTSLKVGADVKSAGASAAGKCSLQLLHPLSAVTLDFLRNDGFSKSALPMTPQDSYVMWRAMQKAYPADVIAEVDPHHYFANTDRITLQDSKEYEDHVKLRLEGFATTHPTETQALLDNYQLSDCVPDFDVCELALSLKEKQMHPCLLFHLNVFDLISLFRQLLEGLERRQAEKHPNHYTGLMSKAAVQKTEKEKAEKQSATNKEVQDDIQGGFLESTEGVIDDTAPHHEFCFHPSGPMSYTEYNDICEEVQRRDKFPGDIKQHALMRALRRGIGFYINDHHFTAYRVAIMRLAMQGKLGIVLSDNSLAYGVNMPFRSCVFAGEMGGQLDTLMAQQMAGRSGRRGLDTQGHLVFAGASASFVQELMLARIPAILGREPRYHTVFLQEMLSQYSNPAGYFEHQAGVLGGRSLKNSIEADTSNPHFRQVSIDALLKLRLIEECDVLSPEELFRQREEECVEFNAGATPSGYRPCVGRANCAQLWMVWEMRDSVPESLVLGCLLSDLYMEFIHRKADAMGDDVHVQITFLAYMVLMLERRPFRTDQSLGYYPQPLSAHSFITGKPELAVKFAAWENKIGEVQSQMAASGVFQSDWMMYSEDVSAGKALDATIFDCIVNPGNVSGLPTHVKQYVKETITDLSIKLIHFHNNLRRDNTNFATDAKYAQFEHLARKSNARLQYISRELIQQLIDFPSPK